MFKILLFIFKNYKDMIDFAESNTEKPKELSPKTEVSISEITSAVTVNQDIEEPLDQKATFDSTKEISYIKPIKEINYVESIENIKLVDSVVFQNRPPVSKKHKLKIFEKRQKNCLTCNTNVKSIIPVCIWYQDTNYIYLKLNILEIDDFTVESTMEKIIFKYDACL